MSCYPKVAGLIPLACPRARYRTPKSAPHVLVGILHGSHRHECTNILYSIRPQSQPLRSNVILVFVFLRIENVIKRLRKRLLDRMFVDVPECRFDLI